MFEAVFEEEFRSRGRGREQKFWQLARPGFKADFY